MNDGHPISQPYSRAGLLAKLTGAAVLAVGSFLVGQGTSQLASTGSGLTYVSGVLSATAGTAPGPQGPTAWSAGAGVIRTGTQIRTDGPAADSILTAGGITMAGALSGATTITASGTVTFGSHTLQSASTSTVYFKSATTTSQIRLVDSANARLGDIYGSSAGISILSTAGAVVASFPTTGIVVPLSGVFGASALLDSERMLVSGGGALPLVGPTQIALSAGGIACGAGISCTTLAASGVFTHFGTTTISGSTASRLLFFGGTSGDGAAVELRGSMFTGTGNAGYLRVASTYVASWTATTFSIAATTASTSYNTGALIVAGGLGVGGRLNIGDYLDVNRPTALTNQVTAAAIFSAESTGTAANGFGVQLFFRAESSTTVGRNIGSFDYSWADATDASRKARWSLQVYDATAAREIMRGETDGTNPMAGFLGAAAVARQTIGAAATDAATTQTLANNIRTALINLGLCSA